MMEFDDEESGEYDEGCDQEYDEGCGQSDELPLPVRPSAQHTMIQEDADVFLPRSPIPGLPTGAVNFTE